MLLAAAARPELGCGRLAGAQAAGAVGELVSGKTRIPEAARQALAGESCSNRTQNGA
jgi:hypothetical protein